MILKICPNRFIIHLQDLQEEDFMSFPFHKNHTKVLIRKHIVDASKCLLIANA